MKPPMGMDRIFEGEKSFTGQPTNLHMPLRLFDILPKNLKEKEENNFVQTY